MSQFLSLVNSIGNKSLPTNNIAWKSCLYRGAWQNCKSIVGLWFDKDYKDFWSVFKLLFGGSSTNVLREHAHFGHLVTEKTEKPNVTSVAQHVILQYHQTVQSFIVLILAMKRGDPQGLWICHLILENNKPNTESNLS